MRCASAKISRYQHRRHDRAVPRRLLFVCRQNRKRSADRRAHVLQARRPRRALGRHRARRARPREPQHARLGRRHLHHGRRSAARGCRRRSRITRRSARSSASTSRTTSRSCSRSWSNSSRTASPLTSLPDPEPAPAPLAPFVPFPHSAIPHAPILVDAPTAVEPTVCSETGADEGNDGYLAHAYKTVRRCAVPSPRDRSARRGGGDGGSTRGSAPPIDAGASKASSG